MYWALWPAQLLELPMRARTKGFPSVFPMRTTSHHFGASGGLGEKEGNAFLYPGLTEASNPCTAKTPIFHDITHSFRK
jgi:hypothetical protein